MGIACRKLADGCHLLFHRLLFLLLSVGKFRAKKNWVTILLEGDGVIVCGYI